ncbi:uncharacterized protein LOC144761391 [Lissotriton helveticus]
MISIKTSFEVWASLTFFDTSKRHNFVASWNGIVQTRKRETTQSKLLDAGAQASGIELPVLPSGTTMRQRNFSMLYNPTHHIAGRRLLPVLPSGTTMRQRNFSMLYNPTHHIAGRRLQPQWFPTDTIMSERRSLLPYSGERLPVWLSRDRMRQRSFSLILCTPHHIAGRVWQPRWPTTEAMMRQNNSLILYSGERLRVWTIQARITQWSNYLMFSVALYNSEGNWLRVWTFQARNTRWSNYVMFSVALYNSEGNWLRVCTFQARITQRSNYVMFNVALYNSEGNWPQWFPADTIRRERRSLLPYSGERLPVCLSRHRMRQRSFSLILSIPHHAGRVCQEPIPATLEVE